MRDLTPDHIPLLREIQLQTRRMVRERFEVRSDELRMFVHYQPSYCLSFALDPGDHADEADHFHVHVVHIEHEGLAGMTVGQGHLLDDLISLVSFSG